eukprot:CAMPEP_0170407788 /NCGR_PEP_ID=MMETSP0117_2-20130122/28435_1 /TAXON_ID=400756 /ORGANISM="Durinskia baltica, Strain CSIRO CS-38" /LENGTH=81 /DNA_ID=CAMNT_0010665061 /DNA_START=289 /DNA_END=532 /DNA_ORIENTATION=-
MKGKRRPGAKLRCVRAARRDGGIRVLAAPAYLKRLSSEASTPDQLQDPGMFIAALERRGQVVGVQARAERERASVRLLRHA